MNEPIIRVLHITEMLSAAGIESFIMNMYRNIDRDKVQFDFLVLRNEKEFYDEEIKSLGGKKYFVHSNIKNTWLRILNEAHQIEEFLKTHPYEIVHIHYTTPLRAPYLLAAKKAGVATRIYHAHSAAVSGKSKLKLLFYEYYRKKIVKWGTTWFACSKAAAEWIFPEQLLQAGNVEIVHNGIDTERFKYNASKRNMIRKQLGLEYSFTLVHTGRFIEQKNQLLILDIFKELKSIHSDAKLLLLGKGELLEKTKEKARRLGIDNDVLFLGVRKNVEDYLSAADCYVMPSLYEGLPVAAVEAECSGLPTVLSENITKEVQLTNNVLFISLDESAEYWSKQIYRFKEALRSDSSMDIVNKGYSIQSEAKKLQQYYEKSVR